MLTEKHINQLAACEDGCDEAAPCEMREAMRWLVKKAKNYPVGTYIPPLARLDTPDPPKSFLTFTARLGRKTRLGTGTVIGSMSWSISGTDCTGVDRTEADGIVPTLSRTILSAKHAGYLLITSGKERHVLDVFLEQFGPELCALGYALKPCMSGSAISFIKITKDKRSWTLCYAESVSGVPVDTLLGYAADAERLQETSSSDVRKLWHAISAYAEWLMREFGTALHPTIGIIALRCARRHLPQEFKKWRPQPLLVAIERDGKGYRGGMTHAARYRGATTRIDVNRQYTHALESVALPYRAAFGRYISPERTPHGVFLCSVQTTGNCTYPLGVWDGMDVGFTPRTVGSGSFVCVLHTSEFEGLRASGATIVPYYGYIFTQTFAFIGYVQRLRAICDDAGRESYEAKLTKPLGNYVYGKFAQKAIAKDLLFSTEKPVQEITEKNASQAWMPYYDEDLKEWPGIWERTTLRYTSFQHVDIAGAITGGARSQTLLMWQRLSSYGLNVVRCHTDSLTVAGELPPGFSEEHCSESIGDWRVESSDEDTIIVGANAYVDTDGAHIAGVQRPTWEMIERIYDGHILVVVEQQNAPMRGFARGARKVRREYG